MLAPEPEFAETDAVIVIAIDGVELVPKLVEVDDVAAEQPELAPPDKAVAAHVRGLVGPHQRLLVVELRPDLDGCLVDLGQRQRSVAVEIDLIEDSVPLLPCRQRQRPRDRRAHR